MPLGCPRGPRRQMCSWPSIRLARSDGATLRAMAAGTSFQERWPRPSVMGVLNVTPDSFSDGGRFVDPRDAIAHGRRLVEEGAALVDVGGESTRPGAAPVSGRGRARARRAGARRSSAAFPVSIDTSKAAVARRALELGAELVNDVTALRADPDLAEVVADGDAFVCLMHMQGEPRTMQVAPRYDDVVSDVLAFRRSGSRSPSPAGSPRSVSASIPASGSASRPTRTSSFFAASTSWPRSGVRYSWVSRARARSARSSATPARRPEAWRRRSRRPSPSTSAVRR